MANIKHAAIDLSIALAAAAALGWSAAVPSQPASQLGIERGSEVTPTIATTEEIVAAYRTATDDALADEVLSTSEQSKGSAVRYCKSPLSGKPQLSTLKS